jgi:hypothetical protein
MAVAVSMYTHDVFDAVTGNYLGELDLEREMQIGEGIASGDGLFRVLSMSIAGPAANFLRMLEVVESNDAAYVARLEGPES